MAAFISFGVIAAVDADVFPGFFDFAADAFCSFVLLDSLRESSGLAAVRGRGGAIVAGRRGGKQGRSHRVAVERGRNDRIRSRGRIDASHA